MYEDLDPDLFSAGAPNQKEMELLNSIRPDLEKVAPDYVAFRDKFGWGHISFDITFYEWVDDMAIYLHEGMAWPKLSLDAWIIGDSDGVQFGISKIDGSLLSVDVENPNEFSVAAKNFQTFIYRYLGMEPA